MPSPTRRITVTGPPWVSLWPTNDHTDCVTKIAPATFCPDCYAQHKSTTNTEDTP